MVKLTAVNSERLGMVLPIETVENGEHSFSNPSKCLNGEGFGVHLVSGDTFFMYGDEKYVFRGAKYIPSKHGQYFENARVEMFNGEGESITAAVKERNDEIRDDEDDDREIHVLPDGYVSVKRLVEFLTDEVVEPCPEN